MSTKWTKSNLKNLSRAEDEQKMLPEEQEDYDNMKFKKPKKCLRDFYNRSRVKKKVKRYSAILFTVIALLVVLRYVRRKYSPPPPCCTPLATFLKTQPSASKLEVYGHAAVVSGAAPCSIIGRDALKKGGHAVDAAIATGLCLGVVIPHNMGLGGGHLALIYDREKEKVKCLDARETAPAAATKDMFKDHPEKSTTTGLSSGVPGELLGYWEAHQQYGKLPWKDLFAGAIHLARNGFKVHPHFIKSLKITNKANEAEMNDSCMRDMVVNKKTGKFWKIGETMTLPKLADTYEKLAKLGASEFYNGQVGKDYVEDILKAGGILTMQDLRNYKVKWRQPINVTLKNNLRYFSSPPPGSGAIVAYILQIIQGYELSPDGIDSVEDFADLEHLIIEAYKFGFAKRSQLGDPDFANVTHVMSELLSPTYADMTRRKIKSYRTFAKEYYDSKNDNKEDHGTAHLSVVDESGNAVSLTSSINLLFGSKIRSKRTGILSGNTMDDFSSPQQANHFNLRPSEVNFIEPGKRPLSSTSPSMFVDVGGDVTLVIGGAGGTLITTAVALVSMRHLWFNQNCKEAIDGPRLHHQLSPEWIWAETSYPKDVLKILTDVKKHEARVGGRVAVVQAICRDQVGRLQANSDYRKGGAATGY